MILLLGISLKINAPSFQTGPSVNPRFPTIFSSVDGDYAFGVGVVALGHIAIEIRGWVSDAPIKQIEFGVIAAGHPGCTASRFP
jgi:hypothetical protein